MNDVKSLLFPNFFYYIIFSKLFMGIGDGDWGLGIWGLGPNPKPQTPKPQTQNPKIKKKKN
jgi:hypothetical protein